MDLRESIDQYQRLIEGGIDRGERDQRGVALDLLREFLGDYAALQTLEALTPADLEEFFVDWYLCQPGVDAEFSAVLLDTVRGWLAWSDGVYRLSVGDRFQPLYERLRQDLPRILEAWELLAGRLHQARMDEAEEAGLEALGGVAGAGIVSSGLNRVLRPDEIDYSAAREDYFRVESVDETAVMLQSPSAEELGEEAVGPVQVPERAAELLRVGDVLYVEVAPARNGWEILEVSRALPAGYRVTRQHAGGRHP